MLGSEHRPQAGHLPLLLSFALFSLGSAAVILVNWIDSAIRVSEDVVILAAVGLVLFTFVLEILEFA